jgi:Novel STAND NTPase 1
MLMEQQNAQNDAPFRSLAELRSAHASLLREVRKDASAANAERVADFIRRAQAAGAFIDGQNDRDSAQGVLDYWAAWQFSLSTGSAASSTPPTLAEFVPSYAPVSKPDENPYVGLRAFDEKDAGFFIGREEATRSLLDKLQLHRIVFVSGPLGSGKSSLVFAGVIPRLRSRSVLDTRKEPIFPAVIPGSDPLTGLLKAILQVAPAKPADENAWVADQRKKLQRAPKSLSGIIAGVAPGAAIVLIVDQFEEIFTLCSDPLLRDQFTQAIAGLVEGANNPNRAILIIREDYAQQTFAIAALNEFAAETDAQFTPPQLTSAELVRVITSAADAVGLKFDDGIIEDLAQDVAGDPASLPTLQFTLSRLWAALPADSNRITRDLYRQVGKPRVALARAAEAAFERLTAEEQAIAQRQFLELVQPTIGGDVRRRRIPLDNLVQLTGDSATQIAAVLKRFEQAELVRRTKSFEAGDDRYEVAHEALVNNWKRLDDWLKVKRQESEKKLQLITAARLWRESGQSPGYLLTGDAIKDAMPYRDQAPEVRDLIAASEASAHRYARIQQIGGTVLAVFVFTVVSFLSVAWFKDAKLSEAFDTSDKLIQQLQVATINSGETAARLRAAEDTIAQQQKVIDQLRQQLQLPAPQPQPKSTAAPTDLSSVGQEGWIWVGSDPDSNLRDARTFAPVLPTAVSPNVRYIAGKNVVLRRDKPTSDTYAQSQSLGLVPNGTPVTALAPAIPYDRPSGTKQYWLRVRVDPSNKPIVYYVFANTSRPDAQQLADTIQAKGYRIPEIQTFDIAKGTNEVRYFFQADRPAAVKLAQDVTQTLKDRRIVLPPTKVVDPTGSPLDRNYPGVLELWLDTSPRP